MGLFDYLMQQRLNDAQYQADYRSFGGNIRPISDLEATKLKLLSLFPKLFS